MDRNGDSLEAAGGARNAVPRRAPAATPAQAHAIEGAARVSRCGRYRYALWRRWADGPQVLFVMLNPSTADAKADDPTIRRCVDFARRWGFGSIAVGNLFAFRTPSPRALRRAVAPVGPRNDAWLARMARESVQIVAAWGNDGSWLDRDRAVRRLLPELHALAFTKSGQPRHPLYLPAAARPQCWTGSRDDAPCALSRGASAPA
ncbi:MAG TPA: DUF1643 domain-containing protein [Burkholderiaceae bacterium]